MYIQICIYIGVPIHLPITIPIHIHLPIHLPIHIYPFLHNSSLFPIYTIISNLTTFIPHFPSPAPYNYLVNRFHYYNTSQY